MASTNVDSRAIEPPIHIENASRSREQTYRILAAEGVSRFPTDPFEESWNQFQLIPLTPPVLAPNAPPAGVVQRLAMVLRPVAGSALKWEFSSWAAPAPVAPPPAPFLSRVIPATFGVGGQYQPALTGGPAYDGHTWVVDGLNHYVEFPYGSPPGLLAPVLTFYRYTGATGGGAAAIDVWHYIPDTTGTSLCPNPAAFFGLPPASADFLVSELIASATTEGAGIRIMFDVSRAAFRAGAVTGVAWNVTNRGAFSAAFGEDNTASGGHSFIGAGQLNRASSPGAFIGGGVNPAGGPNPNNVVGIFGDSAVICGGAENELGAFLSDRSVICGGRLNRIGSTSAAGASFIGGGEENQVNCSVAYAPVSEGAWGNSGAVIGGGARNHITASFGFIGGGGCSFPGFVTPSVGNRVDNGFAVVCGGGAIMVSDSGVNPHCNRASGAWSFVGGGGGVDAAAARNQATALASSVVGGQGNTAGGAASFVGGGRGNQATGQTSSVVGGQANDAGGQSSFVGGGQNHTIQSAATDSAILCGAANTVSGATSRSSIICGSGLLATQNDTAYAQRLTTTGGRQKRVAVFTTTGALALDDHVAIFSNTAAATNMTLSLPAAPVAGQEYWVKVADRVAGSVNELSAAPNVILSTAGLTGATIDLTDVGHTIHVVWDVGGGRWLQLHGDNAAGLWQYAVDATGTSLRPIPAAAADFLVAAAPATASTEGTGIRVMFDVSEAAFRAGGVTGAEWNAANRGAYSAAFGENNTAAASHSAVLGGSGNSVSALAERSSILGGEGNVITGAFSHSVILGGVTNRILVGRSGIVCGFNNRIDAGGSGAILCGDGNILTASRSSIICGGGISATQNDTAYALNLTTTGGRQKRPFTYTVSSTLTFDRNIVVFANASAQNMILNLPATPTDGQEYLIKIFQAPPAVTNSIDGNGNNIFTNTGALATSFDVTSLEGTTYHLVWAPAQNVWLQLH